MTRILVVEDDAHVASFIEKGLRATGFTVFVAVDAESALNAVEREDPDLLVLDLGLPGTDGMHVLHAVRGMGSTVPIIVLTGLAERDVVSCLEQGADDYMRKPFHFSELVARVRTRLRHNAQSSSTVLVAGGLTLDLRTRRVRADGSEVELTSREFALLETFMRHPDQVLSREQLLSQVWGYSFDPSTNLVNVYVNTLRKKVGARAIETVRGAGYRLRP